MNRKDIDNIITCQGKSYIPFMTMCSLSDKPDLCRPYRQMTVKEVHSYLEPFLNSLYLNVEETERLEPYWVSIIPDDESTLFPIGEVLCTISNGSCEGTLLSICVLDRKGKVHKLFTAKYFESEAIVGLIAAEVSKGFDQGGLYQKELDECTIHSQEKTPYQLYQGKC